MNADGTDVKALTDDGHSHDPTWSPDGRRIVYLHDTSWPSDLPRPRFRVDPGWASHLFEELYVMDSDGRDAHLLKRLNGRLSGSPAWSPDGKTLAIGYYAYSGQSQKRDDGTPFALFMLPTNGAGEPRLLFRRSLDAAWSPDGRKLAFSEQVPGAGWAIAVSNAGRSHVAQITNPYSYLESPHIRYALRPAWSPDGTEIAFDADVKLFASWQSPRVGEHQVFVVRADGSRLRQLTTDPDWRCYHPSWAPDGTAIAFSCNYTRTLNACSWGGEGPAIVGPLPPCVRRIFVLRLDKPKATPIQITHIDSANPEFAPVP